MCVCLLLQQHCFLCDPGSLLAAPGEGQLNPNLQHMFSGAYVCCAYLDILRLHVTVFCMVCAPSICVSPASVQPLHCCAFNASVSLVGADVDMDGREHRQTSTDVNPTLRL
jgi:hypothetical protein